MLECADCSIDFLCIHWLVLTFILNKCVIDILRQGMEQELLDSTTLCKHCHASFILKHFAYLAHRYQIHGQWPDKKIWVTEYADTSLTYSGNLTF